MEACEQFSDDLIGPWFSVTVKREAKRAGRLGFIVAWVNFPAESPKWSPFCRLESKPLTREGCRTLRPGDGVLVFCSNDDETVYYDAEIVGIKRPQGHAELETRECNCSFQVRLLHGESKGQNVSKRASDLLMIEDNRSPFQKRKKKPKAPVAATSTAKPPALPSSQRGKKKKKKRKGKVKKRPHLIIRVQRLTIYPPRYRAMKRPPSGQNFAADKIVGGITIFATDNDSITAAAECNTAKSQRQESRARRADQDQRPTRPLYVQRETVEELPLRRRGRFVGTVCARLETPLPASDDGGCRGLWALLRRCAGINATKRSTLAAFMNMVQTRPQGMENLLLVSLSSTTDDLQRLDRKLLAKLKSEERVVFFEVLPELNPKESAHGASAEHNDDSGHGIWQDDKRGGWQAKWLPFVPCSAQHLLVQHPPSPIGRSAKWSGNGNVSRWRGQRREDVLEVQTLMGWLVLGLESSDVSKMQRCRQNNE